MAAYLITALKVLGFKITALEGSTAVDDSLSFQNHRSLPELLLVKETTLRSFIHSPIKPNSYSETSVCASPDGERLVV